MDKFLEKKIRRYVIATLSSSFLARNSINKTYLFTDIDKATKFKSKEMANNWIIYYRQDTGDLELELVVIPVDISYELIQEDFNGLEMIM